LVPASALIWFVPWIYLGAVPLVGALVIAVITAFSRPSDIVFDNDGFKIIGGNYDGFEKKWGHIKPNQVRCEPAGAVWRLTVDPTDIAEATDPDEVASLRAIDAILHDAAGKRLTPATPEGQVLACTACGAPVIPRDEDQITCAFCQYVVAVPPGLRATIHEVAEESRAGHPMANDVARALAGGHASTAYAATFGFGMSAWLTVPAAFMALSVTHITASILPILTVPLACMALARMAIARRRALRALTMGCSAVTSFDPLHPPTCRRCRAPLATEADQVIATCPYCQTSNVLGGLISHNFPIESQHDIESVVMRLRTSERWAAFGLIFSLAFIVGTCGYVGWRAVTNIGESCRSDACSIDGKEWLKCDQGVLVHHQRCDGPTHCSRNDHPSGTDIRCDMTIGTAGELCIEDGSLACTTDRQSVLTCQAGRLQPRSACRGPRGCTITGLKVECDQSLVQPGDVCDHEGLATCSVDRGAQMVCSKGVFQSGEACDRPGGCGFLGDILLCKAAKAGAPCDRVIEGHYGCADDHRSVVVCKAGTLVGVRSCPNGCEMKGGGIACE
jgi:hypothetical protein